MQNTVNVSTEKMDLSDLFPEVSADVESTLFSKEDKPINIDADDEEEEEITPDKPVVPTNTATVPPAKKENISTSPAAFNVNELETSTEAFDEARSGSRSGLIEFFKEKIESGDLKAFDDFDETKTTLDEYLKGFTTKDFDSLWKDNLLQKETDFAKSLPKQYEESLPSELQYAARYVQEGGTDMKGLFKALAAAEEVKQLDPEKDARKLVENYLIAKKYGTDEVIAEQLDEWEDLNLLTKKAQKFKPELDMMEDAVVEQKIAAQANIKKQQQDQYNFYHDSVVEAIRTEDLGGITIDKKTQSALYTGLTQDSFVDSRGKRCTQFEFLLDQIMWAKPDYKKLAKVQWLLQDEEGFEKALTSKKININNENTVRALKTEQAKKASSYTETAAPVDARRTIQRGAGLFKRS